MKISMCFLLTLVVLLAHASAQTVKNKKTAGQQSIVSWDGIRLDIFDTCEDDSLCHLFHDDSKSDSGQWKSLGGPVEGKISGDPTAISWGPNRVDVFVRGTDKAVYHRYTNGSIWSNWYSLYGGIHNGISVATWGPETLFVFVRGLDNRLYFTSYKNQWAGSWQALGGVLYEAPKAVSCQSNQIKVFVNSDNTLWQRSFVDSSWSGWFHVDANNRLSIIGQPEVLCRSSNSLDILVRYTYGFIFHKHYEDGSWGRYMNTTIEASTSPKAVISGCKNLEVFAIDGYRKLNHNEFPSWGSSTNLGGQNLFSVSAIALKAGIAVFAKGRDQQELYPWWSSEENLQCPSTANFRSP